MNWYAIYTKPRQERIALENLERQSYETYLPLIRSKRKRSGKWVESIDPMFSRYLFVRLEPGATSMASIRSTRGVSGLVRFGDQLVAVPDSFVNVLLQTADVETGVHVHEPALFRAGDGVVLTDGPLTDLHGIFEAADGEARAIILMSILGAETRVTVPVDQLGRIC